MYLCRDIELSGNRTPRRRSFYNFFLRHQDAVDDCLTSPSVVRKGVSPSGTLQSMSTASVDDKPVVVHATPKSKRATSFIRKKPPLERGLSAQSALRINKNAVVCKLTMTMKQIFLRKSMHSNNELVRCESVLNESFLLRKFDFFFILSVDGPSVSARDVSILVTEASPECPTAPSPKNRLLSEPSTSTLVHVLVHRESEEYHTDLEEGSTDKGSDPFLLDFIIERFNKTMNFQMKDH